MPRGSVDPVNIPATLFPADPPRGLPRPPAPIATSTTPPSRRTSNTITTLLNAGFDAFTNLYDVVITPPLYIKSKFVTLFANEERTVDSLSVRAMDFTPVTQDVGSSQVHYKTAFMTVPNAKFETDRRFTLSFRETDQYGLLKFFQEWKNLYVNPSAATLSFGGIADTALGGTGSSGTGDENFYGKIEIRGLTSKIGDSSQTANVSGVVSGPADRQTRNISEAGKKWIYSRCSAIKITPPNYTKESSSAATFSVDFYYGAYTDG